MAKFSAAAAAQRKAEELVPVLTERADLFKKFRANDWEINVVEEVPPTGAFKFVRLPDNHPAKAVHFRVKMPGAHPTLVRSFGQLLRFAKGLN